MVKVNFLAGSQVASHWLCRAATPQPPLCSHLVRVGARVGFGVSVRAGARARARARPVLPHSLSRATTLGLLAN